MDEETWDELSTWRKVPMWCQSKSPSREDLDSGNKQWHERRDYRKRTTPASGAEQGYRKPFVSNKRKIGF